MREREEYSFFQFNFLFIFFYIFIFIPILRVYKPYPQTICINPAHLLLRSILSHWLPDRFFGSIVSISYRYSSWTLLFLCPHDIRPKKQDTKCGNILQIIKNIYLTFFLLKRIDSTFFTCTWVTAWRSTHSH